MIEIWEDALMKNSPRLLRSQLMFAVAAAVVLFASGVPAQAAEWFDDWSNGNATDPNTWAPILPGNYDASSGDYVITSSSPANDEDDSMAALITQDFLDVSIRTQARVGVSGTADPNRNSDFDSSGLVPGNDFLPWQKGFGSPGTQPEGDANNDGQVDGGDLGDWQLQYGDPPNIRGGNVGMVARFNPNTGNGYIMVMDDQSQWNLLVVDGPNSDVVAQINDGEGENQPPIDPATGQILNAGRDLMMQLDVTGEGVNTLLEVWFWRPGTPMPAEPQFSKFDPDGAAHPVVAGWAGLLYTEDNDDTQGIFRFAQASDTHLGDAVSGFSAVPEPSSAVLVMLTVLSTGLFARVKRCC